MHIHLNLKFIDSKANIKLFRRGPIVSFLGRSFTQIQSEPVKLEMSFKMVQVEPKLFQKASKCPGTEAFLRAKLIKENEKSHKCQKLF